MVIIHGKSGLWFTGVNINGLSTNEKSWEGPICRIHHIFFGKWIFLVYCINICDIYIYIYMYLSLSLSIAISSETASGCIICINICVCFCYFCRLRKKGYINKKCWRNYSNSLTCRIEAIWDDFP